MESLIFVLNFAALLTFGLSVNFAAFAVARYLRANKLHKQYKGKEYAGALPRHIWKTALGTVCLLTGSVYFIAEFFDIYTLGHGFLLLGFIFLLEGMRELLDFENHRINTVTGKVKVDKENTE